MGLFSKKKEKEDEGFFSKENRSIFTYAGIGAIFGGPVGAVAGMVIGEILSDDSDE